MATLNQEDAEIVPPRHSAGELPRLRWTQILAISIFAFAFNFHWAALLTIILPSQVFKLVGDLQKGTALAFVLVPGAFVSLFANPLFGWLSDRTRGRLATWGRRRPYILVGTLVNVAALVWMASARDIPTLALAYILVQFSSNAAQAPFHALLPDIVTPEQRGLTSGVIGLLTIVGTIAGTIVSGIFIDASRPLAAYQQSLWLVYGLIMAVMITLMLVTIFSVRDRAIEATSARTETQGEERGAPEGRPSWLSRSLLFTLGGTLLAIAVAWGLMTLWNTTHSPNLQLDSNIQQVVLEMLATVGILRLFDFNPRRDPDFAWVLVTRLVMMLGIYTISTFLQFYMRDAVGVAHPEQATTSFIILVSLTSLVSAFAAGWLSDRFGRKRLVYISGFMMALVGVVFVITHSYTLVIAAGAIFGLGYGAYQSVDWALVADVLPSDKNFARDMGVWNIALSLPQVIAPVLGGPIIDSFTRAHNPVLGFQVLFTMAIIYCVLGTVTVRFIRGVKI
ncbi:MAG TPA: MFS transporter [Ktedonobacteraceae bacterium]|nr:MFS transporter [Ktedonobacteraceae bacterium]